MKIINYFSLLLILCVIGVSASAQVTERLRPAEWDNLVHGGRFVDRILPMPLTGELTSNTWGADAVLPRYVDNGIEDNTWSYWGGNVIKGDDGKFHLFVCAWAENSPKGHMEWGNSIVFHAVADNSFGPFKVKGEVGKGHNPEIFQLEDGTYVVYVINGRYTSNSLNGPWEYGKFEFLKRDRRAIAGLSNLTFAKREDGTYLMISRGGSVWYSKTGLSPYSMVTDKSVYPAVKGAYEDPVIWKTNVQYHLVVNDWKGRRAYHLRSKDGANWKIDPGEAYTKGHANYEDGTVVDWFKYERPKVLQDKYGRAKQLHFAVIDTLKHQDKANDTHSSKWITIPLEVGKLMTVLNKKEITTKTKSIKVKIEAEEDFNPNIDIDLKSLRFGAPELVDYGKACKVLKAEKSGDDMIITFEGKGNGFTDNNFAAKLIGKTRKGKMLFAYARLPKVNFNEPVVSACLPSFTPGENGFDLSVEVENFGLSQSDKCKIKVLIVNEDKEMEISSGAVPKLNQFEKTTVKLSCGNHFEKGVEYTLKVVIEANDHNPISLTAKTIPLQ